MEMFKDNPENMDFEWFPELLENPQEISFNNLTDFKNEINKDTIEKNDTQSRAEIFSSLCEVCENPDKSAYMIFSVVSENLTGYEMTTESDFLYDYINELSSRCTVIQSAFEQEYANENILKIQMCINDGGYVIAILDGEQWGALSNPNNINNNGTRTVLIAEADAEHFIAYDLNVSSNKGIKVPVESLAFVDGLMLEVYK